MLILATEPKSRTKKYFYQPSIKSEVIGTFCFKETNEKIEIWDLRIYVDHRGKGHGAQMMKDLIQEYKEQMNHKPLVLYVYCINEIAIHLYEKYGFVIVGDYLSKGLAYEMQYKGGNCTNDLDDKNGKHRYEYDRVS